MKRSLQCLAIGLGLMALAATARAAEIVLERSAVDKLVLQSVFTNGGRYDLLKGPCFAFLDRPSVTIDSGRVRIRSHLSARLGVVDRRNCVGITLASWTEVSGRPVAQGGSVVLVDVRIDSIEQPNLRMLLESGLVPALPGAIELDVLKSVRGMLRDNSGQFEAEVDAFAIDAVTAADNRLAVRFDFRLVAK